MTFGILDVQVLYKALNPVFVEILSLHVEFPGIRSGNYTAVEIN
jgi:hypothetical protein